MLQNIQGFLGATNLDNGNAHAGDRMDRLRDLTTQSLRAVIDRIHQSNAFILVTDLEWKFVIDPRLFNGGRGDAKRPSWASSTKFVATWKSYEDDSGSINCAAFALAYALKYRLDNRAARNIELVKSDARELQTELEWEDTVTLQDIGKFVDDIHYPGYRLVVLAPSVYPSPFKYDGSEFEYSETDRSNIIYLVLDSVQNHYALVYSPGELYRNFKKNNNLKWCHNCVVAYNGTMLVHTCEEGETRKPTFGKKCKTCEIIHLPGDQCQFISCRTCSSTYARGSEYHRCVLMKKPRSEKKNRYYEGVDDGDGTSPALWTYDLESRIEIVTTTKPVITNFTVNEDGIYDENCCIYEYKMDQHVANFICFKNVFSGATHTFFGDDCIERFLLYMIGFNGGNNICLAHNAAGYDTRLVFDIATKMNLKTDLFPIMRGGKFMQLTINQKLVFRDSLLHLKGSLKNLATEFGGGDTIRKGYFPHLFNSVENYDYEGPIPDKKYFDISFTARTRHDIEEFETWHAAQTGFWNFKEELEAYCINDVEVLAFIVKSYHDNTVAHTGMTPWMNATAPSFVHEVLLILITQMLELPDEKEDPDLYKATIQDLAWNKHWAVLKPSEYWFARSTLRGGRTEIRNVNHTVSDEDWDIGGKRIRYQDIHSQYPYQQIVHQFPVGLPRIHVYDLPYHPCYTHRNNHDSKCLCPRHKKGDPFCKIIEHDTQPSEQELIDDSDNYLGFVAASLTPPTDLYHPVLVSFDPVLGKSVASCLPIIEGRFTSIEFIKALQMGYRLDKLHRIDKYNKSDSLWHDPLKRFYLEKMINSREAPEGDELRKMIADYSDPKFDMGDDIQKAVDEGSWGNNPSKKTGAKTLLNSAWGKHAQRPIMPESVILDVADDTQAVTNLFQNFSTGESEYMDAIQVSDDLMMFRYQNNGANANPDLHSGYIPAACFVSGYGRKQLWEMLHLLGPRVVMNDTDSVIYIYDETLANIPVGSILGEWEIEGIDKNHGGIRSFVGLGPKTYGIKCNDGYTSCKVKGLSLKYATSDLVNYDTMENLVKTYLAGDDPEPILVPQKNFSWSINNGMKTHLAMKELKFSPEEMKGDLDRATGRLYPFGFDPSLK